MENLLNGFPFLAGGADFAATSSSSSNAAFFDFAGIIQLKCGRACVKAQLSCACNGEQVWVIGTSSRYEAACSYLIFITKDGDLVDHL